MLVHCLFSFWTGVGWGSDLRFSMAFIFLLSQFVFFDQWCFVVGFLLFYYPYGVVPLCLFESSDGSTEMMQSVFVDVFYLGCTLICFIVYCLPSAFVYGVGLFGWLVCILPVPLQLLAWSSILSRSCAGLFRFDSCIVRAFSTFCVNPFVLLWLCFLELFCLPNDYNIILVSWL
ncbi:unnamed protein product [Brassica oleracea]